MSKVAHYLQEHVSGEVITSADARQYFSTDSSIFSVAPAVIVYPRSENDVRKTARFSWQLAEKGRIISLTARGSGTDQSGAAVGDGIMLTFPAHMNRIIEYNAKTGVVTVEPGINFGKLQQTLQTHGRFLPAYPASLEYSTVGGAVANNASGEKSVKYGDMRKYVRGLRVVLANGEVIETGRINKRELSKKLGQSNFEGEVYRSLDTLIEDSKSALEDIKLGVSQNSAGYDIWDVKHADGSFDLTPLFVGSQSTLGVITEITLDTEPYNPENHLIVADFSDVKSAQKAITEIMKFKELPSAIEMVDSNLLEAVEAINPNTLKGLVKKPYPAVVLLIEFDDAGERTRTRLARRTAKILGQYAKSHIIESSPIKQEELWRIRHASASVLSHGDGQARALPIIEDGIVPLSKLATFMTRVYDLFADRKVPVSIWGHAGDANLHIQPKLDLSQVGDRQMAFRLMDDYYNLVLDLGGSTTAGHGDGRLRAPYLNQMFGDDLYGLFVQAKKAFDPYNTLNPGVKVGVELGDIKPLVRTSYRMLHLYDHLPRS